MSMQQQKLDDALKELLEIVVRERLRIEFESPTEDPQTDYGSFCASSRKISVFKERTDPITSFHVYALAHEVKHSMQWSTLDGYASWLYAIGACHKDDQAENARLELEADEYAVAFLKRYKIRMTKAMKTFIEDRRSHYT